MDRLTNFLPRRPALLMLALVLPALPWLMPAGSHSGPPPATERPSSADASCPSAVVENAQQPGLFCVETSPRRLPDGNWSGDVLATAFPSNAGPVFPDLPSADGQTAALQADQSDQPEVLLEIAQPEVSLKVLSSRGAERDLPPTDSQTGRPKSSLSSPWMHITVGPADATDRLSTPIDVIDEPESPQKLEPADGSLLLPPNTAAQRSAQLERVARQADELIRQGFELASRGAYFAARAEFTKALRLIAQGLDTEHQTTSHSQSLAAGMTALREAGDFIPQGACMEADLDLAAIIEGHRTPVLKDFDTDALTPMAALKCYFTFAQEQLASAAGREVAGSMGLHALGKLHSTMAAKGTDKIRLAESKAMTFYQAALLVCQQNHMAANDLGVLLARNGNYQEARSVLEHSAAASGQATVWRNLALVYRSLGETALAEQAAGRALAAGNAQKAKSGGTTDQMVRWVDSEAFAATFARRQAARPPTPVQRPVAQTPARAQNMSAEQVAPTRPTPAGPVAYPTAPAPELPNLSTNRPLPPAPSPRDPAEDNWVSKVFSVFKKN